MQKLSRRVFGSTKPSDIFLDLLTFERLLTKPVIHIIYWAGLMLLCLAAFSIVGGAVGIALKEEQPWGWFLAFPFLIGGLIFVVAGMLLWRSFCEFYVAIFRIADDLHYLRNENEGQALRPQSAPQTSQSQPAQPASSPLSTARVMGHSSEARPSYGSDNRPLSESHTESRPFPAPVSMPEDSTDSVVKLDDEPDGIDEPFFRRHSRSEEN